MLVRWSNRLICKINPSVYLFVEIAAEVVWSLIEHLEDEQGNLPVELRILLFIEHFLQGLYKIVPPGDKCLIALQIRNLKPAVDPNFRFAGHIAPAVGHKIAESFAVVLASEREETAEAGTEVVNLAAAVVAEEGAAYIIPAHEQVGENEAAVDVQTDADVYEVRKALFQVAREHEDVVGIEVDGVIHSVAALTAAVAGFAGDFCEVAGSQEFVHVGSFLEGNYGLY